MKYYIQTEKDCLVSKKDIYGKTKLVSKNMKMFVGIVSPFNDPIIMYTRYPSETIIHTDEDILMVTQILHKKGIKHKVNRIENKTNFRTISKI